MKGRYHAPWFSEQIRSGDAVPRHWNPNPVVIGAQPVSKLLHAALEVGADVAQPLVGPLDVEAVVHLASGRRHQYGLVPAITF